MYLRLYHVCAKLCTQRRIANVCVYVIGYLLDDSHLSSFRKQKGRLFSLQTLQKFVELCFQFGKVVASFDVKKPTLIMQHT